MKQTILLFLAVGFSFAQSRYSYNPFTGRLDIAGDAAWKLVGVDILANRPTTCTANKDVFICNGAGCATGGMIHYCKATNTWEAQGTSGSVAMVSSILSGQMIYASADDILAALTLGASLTIGGVPGTINVVNDTSTQKVAARRNSTGGDTGTRRRINFIEGTGITFVLADDAGDNELDLTINATAAAASAFAQTFASSTPWSLTGATHGLGTCDLAIEVWDASGNRKLTSGWNDITCTAANFDITVNWPGATAGRLVLIKGGGGGGGGGMADPGANGVMVRTALNTSINRTITGTASEIDITNGDGVSGNPTVSIPATFRITGKTATAPVKTGTSPPGTCTVGDLFFDTDASAGLNFFGCSSTNVWTLQGDGGAGGLPAQGGNANKLLSTNGSSADWRAIGAGLLVDATSARVDPATVPTYLTGTASLDFSSIAQSACAELTITVTGAATGDSVEIGAPSAIDAGFVWSGFVSAINTVTVRLCKITTGAADPSNATWRATVVRSF